MPEEFSGGGDTLPVFGGAPNTLYSLQRAIWELSNQGGIEESSPLQVKLGLFEGEQLPLLLAPAGPGSCDVNCGVGFFRMDPPHVLTKATSRREDPQAAGNQASTTRWRHRMNRSPR